MAESKGKLSSNRIDRLPKILIILLTALVLASFGHANAQTPEMRMDPSRRDLKTIVAVQAVLKAQADAWNRGDIEGYMDGYARGDNTVFISGDNLTRGWQTVLDRYKRNYNSREKMGTLTFSDLGITVLSKDAALVLGRWHLLRANDEPHGRFTLVFRKTKQGWKIVHDHTSSAN
jgi:ketosteroid isomerase-like protein